MKNDKDLGTDEVKDDVQTEDTSATEPEVTDSATQDEELEKLKVANQELLSARDKNFEDKRSAEERLDELEAIQERDKYIKQFLKDNKSDYEYVEQSDLEEAYSPEQVKAIADKTQAKAEKLKKDLLKELNDVPEPVQLTGEAKSKKLESLKKQAEEGKDVFGEMLETEGIV